MAAFLLASSVRAASTASVTRLTQSQPRLAASVVCIPSASYAQPGAISAAVTCVCTAGTYNAVSWTTFEDVNVLPSVIGNGYEVRLNYFGGTRYMEYRAIGGTTWTAATVVCDTVLFFKGMFVLLRVYDYWDFALNAYRYGLMSWTSASTPAEFTSPARAYTGREFNGGNAFSYFTDAAVLGGEMVVMSGRSVARSSDGMNWTQYMVPATGNSYLTANRQRLFTDALWGHSLTGAARALVSANRGSSWTEITLPTGDSVIDYAANGTHAVYIVLNAGASYVRVTTDRGATWTSSQVPNSSTYWYNGGSYAGIDDKGRVYTLWSDQYDDAQVALYYSDDYTNWTNIPIGITGVNVVPGQGVMFFNGANVVIAYRGGMKCRLDVGTVTATAALTTKDYRLDAAAVCVCSTVYGGATRVSAIPPAYGDTYSPSDLLPDGSMHSTSLLSEGIGTTPFRILSVVNDGEYVTCDQDGTVIRTDGVVVSSMQLPQIGIDGYSYNIEYLVKLGDMHVAFSRFNVLISTDNCATWTHAIAPTRIYSAVSTGTYLAIPSGSGLLVTTDGVNWTSRSTPSSDGISSRLAATKNALFVSDTAHVYRSLDGGVTWTQVFTANTNLLSTGRSYQDIVFAGPSNDSYNYSYTSIYYSLDDGTTYTEVRMPYTSMVPQFRSIDRSTGQYIAKSHGAEVFTFSGAPSAIQLNTAPNNILNGSAIVSIAVSEGASTTFTELTPGPYYPSSSAYDGAYYFLMEASDALGVIQDWRSVDGVTWTAFRASRMNSVAMGFLGNLYVIEHIGSTNPASLTVSTDHGVTSSDVTPAGMVIGTNPWLSMYAYDDALYVWEYTSAGQRWKTTDGSVWTLVDSANPGFASASTVVVRGCYLYAANQSRPSFYVSGDNGASWTASNPPGWAIFGDDGVVLALVSNNPIYVYRSDDYGAHFYLVSTVPGTFGYRGYAAGVFVLSVLSGSVYSMYYSTNNGDTWTKRYNGGEALAALVFDLGGKCYAVGVPTYSPSLLIDGEKTSIALLEFHAYLTSTVTCVSSASATFSDGYANCVCTVPAVNLQLPVKFIASVAISFDVWAWLRTQSALYGSGVALSTASLSRGWFLHETLTAVSAATASLKKTHDLTAPMLVCVSSMRDNARLVASIQNIPFVWPAALTTKGHTYLAAAAQGVSTASAPLAFHTTLIADDVCYDGAWIVGATLTARIALASTASCTQAISTPSLLTAIQLEGTAIAASSGPAAALTSAISLTASVTGGAISTAILSHDELRSAQAVVTLATGDLTHIIRLSDVAVMESAATGELTAYINLAAVAQTVVTASGAAAVRSTMEAIVSANSTAMATLRVIITLQAGCAAGGTATGDLSSAVRLSGTALVYASVLEALIATHYPDEAVYKSYVSVLLTPSNTVYTTTNRTDVFVASKKAA